MRTAKDVRLFFALWPDDEVRFRIDENRKRYNINSNKGRLVCSSNLHLTLHYIGNTTIAEMTCLDRQARQVNAGAFNMILDCAGYFKTPKVLWIGCQTVPQGLIDLQQNLGQEISKCQFTPEVRPYSPHVTVARKIYHAPEPVVVTPIDWAIDRFVMVESISVRGGVRYEVVESYSFC